MTAAAPASCSAFAWADHACRFCGARVAVAEGPKGPVYSCGSCGLEAQGAPEGICGCGVHLGPKGKGKAPKPGEPRFRCVANPARSVSNPSVIVIEFA